MILIDSFGLTEVAVLLFTIFVAFSYWAFVSPLSYWQRKGIPNVSGVIIFGSLWDAVSLKVNLGQLYADIYNKFKGKRYAGFVKFNKPGIVICDPELIKNVLLKDFSHFHDNDVFMDEKLDPLMARNIFVVAGENWKKIRAGVSPAFTTGKIKSVFPLILEICEELKNHYREKTADAGNKGWEIEMKDMAARYTTEVVSSCVFGIRSGAIKNPDSEFRQMGRRLLEPTPLKGLEQLIILVQPTLSKILRLRFFPRDIASFFRGVVKEVVNHREATGTNRNDYLHFLVQLEKTGKLGLAKESDKDFKNREAANNGNEVKETAWSKTKLDDITAQAVGFFTDGFETSSTLLGFFMLEMAHNPSIQERLRHEVKESIEKHGGITYDGLCEMSYMEMVVQETLRKYPPAVSFTRICTKRYRLPSVEEGSDNENGPWVEKGMPVVVPVYGIHHDPKHFPNPDVFDPERFSEEGKKSRHRFVHLPIGEGPRICIGIKFGLAQTKAAIATILSEYEIIPSAKTKLPITVDPTCFLLASKDGLWVRFRPIK